MKLLINEETELEGRKQHKNKKRYLLHAVQIQDIGRIYMINRS
jgi:hypothetical protein